MGSIPKLMAPIYEKVVGLTDDVCKRQLNSEYRDLARAMAAALCRKRPSPLRSGQPRTWACSIVYVLGRINFLGDPSFPPHMTTAKLCAEFQVGESTVHAKARAIENALGIGPFDPQWMLRSLAERNPLVWMAEVNGLLVDLRDMPREVQEIGTIALYGPNLNQATQVAVGIGAIRERRGRRDARWTWIIVDIPSTPAWCGSGIHGEARCADHCDDGWHHRLPSSGGHRPRGRIVSSL